MCFCYEYTVFIKQWQYVELLCKVPVCQSSNENYVTFFYILILNVIHQFALLPLPLPIKSRYCCISLYHKLSSSSSEMSENVEENVSSNYLVTGRLQHFQVGNVVHFLLCSCCMVTPQGQQQLQHNWLLWKQMHRVKYGIISTA